MSAQGRLIQCIFTYIKEGFTSRSSREYQNSEEELQVMWAMLHDDEDQAHRVIPSRIEHYLLQDQRETEHRLHTPHKDLAYFTRMPWRVGLCTAPERVQNSGTRLPFSFERRCERILQINEFTASRVMYMYHDLIDHLCFFNYLDKFGTFDRFPQIFAPPDHPSHTHLYSRSSEHVSGVCFGLRHFAMNPLRPLPDQAPLIILEYLQEHAISLEDTLPEAYDQVCALLQSVDRADLTAAVMFDVISQVTDERRVWGIAKSGRDQSPIRLISPEYLLFIGHCVYLFVGGQLPILAWSKKVACWTEDILGRLQSLPLGRLVQFSYQEFEDYDPKVCPEEATIETHLALMTQYI